MQSVQLNVTVLLSKADGLIQLYHATCSQMSNLMNQARLKVLKARDDLIAVSISEVNTQSLFLPCVRKWNCSLKKIWFSIEWLLLQHTKMAFQAALKRPWGLSPALLISLFSVFITCYFREMHWSARNIAGSVVSVICTVACFIKEQQLSLAQLVEVWNSVCLKQCLCEKPSMA